MAREVRNIRSSLGGLGLNETLMPQLDDIDGLIEAQDFAGLAMAVEDHRSMLRKVPLKPPMLYFYVTSEYGYRIHPVLKTKRFHHGIDLAGTWQETVHATAPAQSSLLVIRVLSARPCRSDTPMGSSPPMRIFQKSRCARARMWASERWSGGWAAPGVLMAHICIMKSGLARNRSIRDSFCNWPPHRCRWRIAAHG